MRIFYTVTYWNNLAYIKRTECIQHISECLIVTDFRPNGCRCNIISAANKTGHLDLFGRQIAKKKPRFIKFGARAIWSLSRGEQIVEMNAFGIVAFVLP